MLAIVEQLKSTTQLRWNKVHKFRAKIAMHVELGSYIIKTASTYDELLEGFRLRDEVFNQEFKGLTSAGLDFDRFDYHFDHLLIFHKESQKIIGTYRLNCSTHSQESYTALEFDLGLLGKLSGPRLELGRACIQRDFRKGSVMSLLWRGIAEYMNLSKSILLFGCSSIKINNAREAALVYRRLLDLGVVTHEYLSHPTPNFIMPDFEMWFSYFRQGLNSLQTEEAESLMPSLLKSYLKMGARIASEPAFDTDFNCIDLLTVLRKEDLANGLAERFRVVR